MVYLIKFFCLQLTVEELAALPVIRTMANQLVSISASEDVSVSHWSVL